VLEQFVVAVEEIFAEVVAEIAADPWAFVAEVVQFLVLVAVVWVVAFGFGKRKGFVKNMLAERASTVEARLVGASHADEDLAQARKDAASTVRSANAEARRLIAEAKQDADDLEAKARAEADAEAERLVDRARAALETERAEMQLEMREALVDLVAQSTRSIMNEKVPVARQRKLIESAISSSAENGEHHAALQPVSVVGVGGPAV